MDELENVTLYTKIMALTVNTRPTMTTLLRDDGQSTFDNKNINFVLSRREVYSEWDWVVSIHIDHRHTRTPLPARPIHSHRSSDSCAAALCFSVCARLLRARAFACVRVWRPRQVGLCTHTRTQTHQFDCDKNEHTRSFA